MLATDDVSFETKQIKSNYQRQYMYIKFMCPLITDMILDINNNVLRLEGDSI